MPAMNKMSMSLDEIVKSSRATKEPTAGGKAKKDKGGRAAPYSKGGGDAPRTKDKKEKPEREPAEPSTEVFVGNLPFTTDAATVKAHLSAVAACTVELKMRQRGGESKPSGCAIAAFESIESATKAVNELNESELEGRNILIRFSRPDVSPKKEKPEKEKPERAPAEPSTEVFVGNLPFTTDAATVEAHLSAVAACTVELKMRQRGKGSKPAGFAIASFESIESATKAVNELNESKLEGRNILVRFSTTT